MGFTGTRSISTINEEGEHTETLSGEYHILPRESSDYDPPEILWHYSEVTGLTQKVCPIGMSSANVFTGGWYGGGRMFQGAAGDGSVMWTYEPAGSWTSLGTGTAASDNQDIYYAIQTWDTAKGANSAVHCFNAASSVPTWSYDGTGSFDTGAVDTPGKYACSADGSVLAVGGAINGHMAIHFFSNTSSVPLATYEDDTLAYYPRQLRITDDGSKCIFRTAANLYRIDTATGTLEAHMELDASNDCFGVSPDGSVIAYGFTAARIATWDGSGYSLVSGMSVPGYYGGAAAVAADNSTIYFGFYKNDYKTNRIIRYDLDAGAPVWTYDYPSGSGGYQDVMEWMDCSADGRWLVAGSWGCETGGGDEVNVFDDLNPDAPVFSIDTPGSIFHVDITEDGRYISAAGKHVHANQMGSGTDVYMGEVDIMGIVGVENTSIQLSLSPNPSTGSFSAAVSMAEPGLVELSLFDISGRCRLETSLEVTDGNTAQITADLPPGIYTCRVQSGSDTVTDRLAIIR